MSHLRTVPPFHPLGAGLQMAPDSGPGDSHPTCWIAKANSGLLHERASMLKDAQGI